MEKSKSDVGLSNDYILLLFISLQFRFKDYYFNTIIIFAFAMIYKLSKIINPFALYSFSKLKPPTTFQPIKPTPGLKSAPPVPLKNPSKLQAPNITKTKIVEKTPLVQQQAPIIKKKHPVVTIMGHVDHGKTTLIDYLRESNIAQGEAGGITQRIGAFRIDCLGEKITFIDTPGHEAFTNMRQRGASVTDLIVLVVSAVQGVKKQTIQVIQLIKKLEAPVIVALNKIDLPQASPEIVEKQLEEAGLHLQINGGNIPIIHISAKTGKNVGLLCELIIEQTKNATAVFNGLAYASVLQANKTKQGLNSMTVIVEKGTIKTNSVLILKTDVIKVKTMLDDKGKILTEANPGAAIQIVGIPLVPAPGDLIFEVQNEQKAKLMIQKSKSQLYENERLLKQSVKNETGKVKLQFKNRRQRRAFYSGVQQIWMNKFAEQEQKIVDQLDQLRKKEGDELIDFTILQLQQKLNNHKKYVFQYIKNSGNDPDTFNFMMKFADRGMEETILLQLEKLKPQIQLEAKIKLNLIKSDIGDVTVTDIDEARLCAAKIFTFGSGISSDAKAYLEEGQQPKVHKLIHSLLKDIREVSMKKKMEAIKGIEKARCDVAELYTLKMKKKEVKIPGIKVISGKITKKAKAYILRDGIPISSPLQISFIKSFKKQVVQLKKGEQGTMGFIQETPEELTKGDQIAFFEQN